MDNTQAINFSLDKFSNQEESSFSLVKPALMEKSKLPAAKIKPEFIQAEML